MALINTNVLEWEGKPEYPWLLIIKVGFEHWQNGMPDAATQELMDTLEDDLMDNMPVEDGYIHLEESPAMVSVIFISIARTTGRRLKLRMPSSGNMHPG